MSRIRHERFNLNRRSHVRKLRKLEAKGWRIVEQTKWGLFVRMVLVKDS